MPSPLTPFRYFCWLQSSPNFAHAQGFSGMAAAFFRLYCRLGELSIRNPILVDMPHFCVTNLRGALLSGRTGRTTSHDLHLSRMCSPQHAPAERPCSNTPGVLLRAIRTVTERKHFSSRSPISTSTASVIGFVTSNVVPCRSPKTWCSVSSHPPRLSVINTTTSLFWKVYST